MADFRCSVDQDDMLCVSEKADSDGDVEFYARPGAGPLYLSRSEQLALRDHLNVLLEEDEEAKPNAFDLIGKKVKIVYTSDVPDGEVLECTQTFDNVVSITVIEDYTPPEPVDASRIEFIYPYGVTTSYSRAGSGWRGERTGYYSWDILVCLAQRHSAKLVAIRETREEI